MTGELWRALDRLAGRAGSERHRARVAVRVALTNQTEDAIVRALSGAVLWSAVCFVLLFLLLLSLC